MLQQLHKLQGRNLFIIVLLVMFMDHVTVAARIRKYHVAAQEVVWDYSAGDPSNLLDLNDQASADKYFRASFNRIGSKYKKALYFEYTDATFTTQKPKPTYLGLLGPVIRGEVGDCLEITFFNNATHEFSMHPHGLHYLKNSESALYMDGTSGRSKEDDIVFPGQKVTMTWNITDSHAPTAKDPNCIPWVYHSHIDTPRDTNSGMIGTLITCKPGVLDDANQRTDVAHDYPILVKIMDENLSWFKVENSLSCPPPNLCPGLRDAEDEGYISSNYMASLNGLMFGHLQGIEACLGDRIAFYVIGLGNEFDVHSLHFHGQQLEYQHTRGDTVSVFSATFIAAETSPTISGFFQITDMVGENEKDGLGAYWFTKNCTAHPFSGTEGSVSASSTVEYFLSAEEVTWDYGPSGFDGRSGKALTDPTSQSATFFESGNQRVGGKYKKAVFVQYSDSTFTTKVSRSQSDKYQGLLGPVLRASPGDTLKVTLKNKIRWPVSLLPHGVIYPSRVEMISGSLTSGGSVNPGDSFTYQFKVPGDILGSSSEPCQNYIYTSGHDPTRDHNTGLVGPILICQRGYNASGKQQERFLLLTIFDENQSLMFDDNIAHLAVSREDPDFQESNLMFSVNGYSFANLPSPKSCNGDEVTWYVMSLGSDLDVHALSFDGNTFTKGGKHRDVQSLVAGSTAALKMIPTNAGTWIMESHSHLALTNGMYGFYEVDGFCGKTDRFVSNGVVREYFIAAEEEDWDYAPVERSPINGLDLNDPRSEGNIFIKDDENFIGDVYKKAIYREYTNVNFTTRISRGREDDHMGILGPAIWAETGDIIKIEFKNLASRPYSMHAHGVQYDARDSGVDYVLSQGVPPGQSRTYWWTVPDSSGPGVNDPNCIPWLYFSAVDQERDVNSGLVGGLIICRAGTLNQSGKGRRDVDRELFVLMNVFNENKSWYLEDNIQNHAPFRNGTKYELDGDFEESNKMHAINGRVFGNHPDLVMSYNSTVAWYFFSIGTEIDLHTFHIHGHTLLHNSENHRDDSIPMFPGMAESLEMIADNPGTWLLHCHVNDHISAGMETVYTVLKPGQTRPS